MGNDIWIEWEPPTSHMKKYGKVMKIWKINGKLWKNMENICKNMETFGKKKNMELMPLI